MYAQILVPTDGSACSDEAVAHGVAIAKAMGAAIVFVFVMDALRARQEGVVNIAEAREALTARGGAILSRAEQTAIVAGVPARAEIVEGSPAEVIVSRSDDFDLVVMGSHGKGILKWLATGSVTESVLHRVTRPLLVVRGTSPAMRGHDRTTQRH